MMISTEKSAITILSTPMQLLKPSDKHYLKTHLNVTTAYSFCVAGRVASLLLPYPEVEDLLLIHMQCGRPCAAFHPTASSSLQPLFD
jgi:hypothetical protein